MGTTWLTDKVVRDLPLDGVTTYDGPDPKGRQGWTSGFGVKAYAGGAKTFVLRYRSVKTRMEHRYTIGSWPVWSVEAARRQARELKHRIEKGEDPQAEKKAARGAKTVADLCKKFVEEYLPKRRANTQRDYRNIIENEIRPRLGKRLVAAIDYDDVGKLHGEITKRAPHRANRVVAVLSRMMTLAMRDRLRPDNPCKGIERNHEEKRKRYLTKDELARLTKALADYPDQQVANVFRLLLLVGARKHEVLSAQWDQFDLTAGRWTKPGATTKQRTEHRVPLGNAALALLKDMSKAAAEDATFLFPGRGKTGHLAEVKKPWAAICGAAGITGLRTHDLRHSYASVLASQGLSLPTIGAMLGHTQPQTTHRYAHLFDEALKDAANRAGAVMAGLVPRPARKGRLRAIAGGKR